MFGFFRKNHLYSKDIEPHCAYCSHCTKDNEHQGVCDLRGIVALAGSCKKFQYNPLMRVPPKPARIRGRFTDEDFFFEDRSTAPEEEAPAEEQSGEPEEAPESSAETEKPQTDEAETERTETPAEPEDKKEGENP